MTDASVLSHLFDLYKSGDKKGWIEVLLECYTSRVAACLPVLTLDPMYYPNNWDCDIHVDQSLQNLVVDGHSLIRFDALLAHLVEAWSKNNVNHLLTYIKLVSICHDTEKRSVTPRGAEYLIGKSVNLSPGLVALSALYKHTSDPEFLSYITSVYNLAAIKDAPMRLILFSVICQVKFKEQCKKVLTDFKSKGINWEEIGFLDKMPEWAVDKHTFRGKYGKGCIHLVKRKGIPKTFTDTMVEEFYGPRPKRDLDSFFREAVVVVKEMFENPFYPEVIQIYHKYPKHKQKTVHMTKIYFEDFKVKYPELLGKSKIAAKRKLEDQADQGKSKTKRKRSSSLKPESPGQNDEISTQLSDNFPETSKSEAHEANSAKPLVLGLEEEAWKIGPLLQLPTGSAKVYARLDLRGKKVWKGPYRKTKLANVMFFHTTLRSVLKDKHTLPVELQNPYVSFPLLRGKDGEIEIEIKDYRDCIAKTDVKDGRFVSRQSLGIICVHRLQLQKIQLLPASFWVHFLYRFALNIGDSGLYNAVTDDKLSFLYGIDMEEVRGKVKGNTIIDVLFSKCPARAVCQEILKSVRRKREELLQLLSEPIDLGEIDKVAVKYGFEFKSVVFKDRLETCKIVLSTLK